MCDYTHILIFSPWGEYIKNAALGTFMFLSGYLLASKYLLTTKAEVIGFIKKRFIRLYPLYILALLVFWCFGQISFQSYIWAATGLSTFSKPQVPTLWFISLILIFYIIFTFLSNKTIFRIILYSSLILGLMFLLKSMGMEIERRFFYYFPSFVVGIIMGKSKSLIFNSGYFQVFWLLLFCGIVWCFNFFPKMDKMFEYISRAIISFSGCIGFLGMAKILSKKLIIRRLSYRIAYISMAAYLFHRQIFSVLRHLYWPEGFYARLLYIYLFCLPIVFVFAFVIQRLYDKTTTNLKI